MRRDVASLNALIAALIANGHVAEALTLNDVHRDGAHASAIKVCAAAGGIAT